VKRGENQVARKCSFNRDFRRFNVSDFSDHDDVRVLSKEGSKRGRKGHTGLSVHLNLVNTVHLVHNRVICGQDVDADRIELGKN